MDVPMELSRIIITELGEQQVIFLKEKGGERSFPIMIGIAEALAIDRRLKGVQAPRPLTHDLLADTITALGGRLEKIVINDLRDHTFIATLHVSQDGQAVEIDARPSDAIALGAAFNTPIFVAEKVLTSLFEPAGGGLSKESKIDLLKNRLKMLAEHIAEINTRLADDAYVAQAGEETIKEHRRQLNDMQSEYDAIDRVLKKVT